MPRRKFRVTQSPPLPPNRGYSSLDGVSTLFTKKPENFRNFIKIHAEGGFRCLSAAGVGSGQAGMAGSSEPELRLPPAWPGSSAPAGARGAVGPRVRTRGSRRRGSPTLQATRLRNCFLQPWPCRSLLLRNTFSRAEGCSRCTQLGALPGPEIEIFKALQNY